MTTELQKLAGWARAEFEERIDDEGEAYYARPGTDHLNPDWVFYMIRDAHGEWLPDNYRYRFIVDALEYLTEYEDEDVARESVGDEASCNHYGLARWFASGYRRTAYIDEAMSWAPDHWDISQIMGEAMADEIREVFDSVAASLHAELESRGGRFAPDIEA